MNFGENEYRVELLKWFPIPPLFLVDTSRVNLCDLVNPRPGQIIRADGGFDGPPIVVLSELLEKWYPIEDEL